VISVDDILVEDIKSRILKICGDIVKNGITQEEFAREKQNSINNWKSVVKTNQFWLESLKLSQRLDENFDFIDRSQKHLQNITIADINNIAKEFLKNPVFAQMKEE
jgi:predicted Zn-dependent peptidase